VKVSPEAEKPKELHRKNRIATVYLKELHHQSCTATVHCKELQRNESIVASLQDGEHSK